MTLLDGLSGHVSVSFEENYESLKQGSRFTARYIVVGILAMGKKIESDVIGKLVQTVKMVANIAEVSKVSVDRTSVKCRGPCSRS